MACVFSFTRLMKVSASNFGRIGIMKATMIPAMDRLRTVCDALERRTDEDLWPFPNYHALLFQ